MEQICILDRSHIRQWTTRLPPVRVRRAEIHSFYGIEQSVHIIFERHPAPARSLKMMMVRGRSSALGSVIEKYMVRIDLCEIKNIHIPSPDRLRLMLRQCYHQMIRENRVWIDQNVIFLSLSAFKTDMVLLGRPVVPAQETFSCLQRRFVGLRRGRDDTRRIVLDFNIESTYRQSLDLHSFKRTEITARKRPAGKLVIDESV